MALSRRLLRVDLTLEGKHCGHPIIKPGGSFMRATQFNCEGCKREVQLTYEEKIALFAKHSHLTSRIWTY